MTRSTFSKKEHRSKVKPWRIVLTALLAALGLCTLIATVANIASSKAVYPAETSEETLENKSMPQATLPLRTVWFGHSLMEYRAAADEGVPAINIPLAVDAIHEQARQAGRSLRAPGVTTFYYDGPHDLGHWLRAGGALDKIRAEKEPLDFVIGVGFMHLVPQKGGHLKFRSRTLAPPNLLDNLKGAVKDIINIASFGKSDAREVERLTRAKYEFIRAVAGHDSTATWLNYVAPVMNDRSENQASVDARFACIVETAKQAGTRAANVPVGKAFRMAEKMALREGLSLELQRADRLHYTALGAYLAANVFFSYLYQIDPRGLPVPESLIKDFSKNTDEKLIALLQEVSWETISQERGKSRMHCDSARLPIDDQARTILK